jgi:hypothetical protein
MTIQQCLVYINIWQILGYHVADVIDLKCHIPTEMAFNVVLDNLNDETIIYNKQNLPVDAVIFILFISLKPPFI